MSDELSQDQTEDRLLGQAASEFLAAVSRGENPSVGDYAKRYPTIAPLIEQALPAIAMLKGSEADQGSNKTGKLPKTLGDFQIIQEIGRGGMGVVYEAEQISMGRNVALKILPLTAMLDETRLERFQNEVRAAATLDHPHCVPIYAVGEDQGVHYYAMKLILGQTLAEVIHELQKKDPLLGRSISQISADGKQNGLLKENRDNFQQENTVSQEEDTTKTSQADSLSISRNSKSHQYFRQIAKLGVQTAEALHHAHERGIVHRDIKPSNLILDTSGSIWITDFGLARIETDAGLTLTGDFLGTLRYMSPEQALGKHALVDHRADIYSLGITLYELLALRPAIEGEDRVKILRDFAESEPPSLSKLVPSIPIELETIIAKAIEKNPSDRYATAEELAADLGRYLRHEPIFAKRSSLTERTIKWVRRHPMAASLIAVSLMALFSVVGLSLRHASELGSLNVELKQSIESVTQNQTLMEHYVYMADINLAYRAWEDNDLRACENMLLKHLPKEDEAPPGIEWRLLWRLSHPPVTTIDKIDSPLYAMTISPQGDVYAVAGEDSVVRIYDINNDRLIAQFPTEQIEINSVDFSPDGRKLATTGDDGTVKIWRFSDHSLLTEFRAYTEKAHGAKYLPDGKSMFTWGKNPSVYLWDLENGEKIGSFECPKDNFESVCLSADGKWLFTGDNFNEVTIFDVEQLKQADIVKTGGRTNCLAHAPNKNMIFAGTSRGAVLGWRIGEKEPFLQIERADSIQCISINSNEDTVAFGDGKGIIHVCNLNDTTDVMAIPAHLTAIQSLQFTPDGKRLISCGRDGQIKSHLLGAHSSQYFHKAKLEEPLELQWFSVVGDHQIVGHQAKKTNARFIMLDTNHLEKPTWDISVSANYAKPSNSVGTGRYLATYDSWSSSEMQEKGYPAEVLVIETNTGNIVHRWPWEREPCSITLSHEANLLAVAHVGWHTQLFNIETGEQLDEYELPALNNVAKMCLSPDGQILAFANLKSIYLLDTKSGKIVKTLEGLIGGVSTLTFSPDGSHVAAGCGMERDIRIWNVDTGKLTAELTGHLKQVYSLQFLSDHRLLSSDVDGFALWDIPSHQQYFYHKVGRHSHDLFEAANDKESASMIPNVIAMPPEDWLVLSLYHQSPQFLKLDVSDVWPKR